MGEAPLATDVEAALAAPALRTDAQVALLVAQGGAGYRKLWLLLWAAVLVVAALVGFTTDGEEVAARISTPAGERLVWTSGVTRSLREADSLTVSYDPEVPGEAGVVVPGLGILLGRAKVEA